MAERSAAYDATLKYRIVLDRVAHSANLADSTPQLVVHPAKVADSDPAKVADSSLQKEEVPTPRSSRSERVAPVQHPSRQITADWEPRPEFWQYLAETYPHADVWQGSVMRFRNYQYARQATSKSFEALLENWVSNDNERAEQNLKAGTDDLGVPRAQGKKSVVPDGPQPGDPDYLDPTKYLG